MGALRRSHAAAALALAALLLLLLARQTPPKLSRPPPLPAAAAERSSPANRTTAASTTRRPTAPSSKLPGHDPPSPASQVAESAKPVVKDTIKAAAAVKDLPVVKDASIAKEPVKTAKTSAKTAGKDERPVLTGELYVAGHSRPHPELCPALGARLSLVILVTSAPSHRQQRDAVRLTWGHFALRSDVSLGFVLGAPPAAMTPALEQEDALYGDLIVGRSVDSYANLTLKTLSMLEWVDTYCPRAPRLLKTDDDMFINVPKLLQFAAAGPRANATKTVWGKVMRKSLPKRSLRSKYYVSPRQFPGRVFPDFATGPAYLLTADTAAPALAAAMKRRYLPLEDVFLTGLIADEIGVKRVHAPEFYNRKVAAHPCAVQRGVAIHMVRYHEQFDLWRKLLDGKTKCAS